jgi:hypothetical protein
MRYRRAQYNIFLNSHFEYLARASDFPRKKQMALTF